VFTSFQYNLFDYCTRIVIVSFLWLLQPRSRSLVGRLVVVMVGSSLLLVGDRTAIVSRTHDGRTKEKSSRGTTSTPRRKKYNQKTKTGLSPSSHKKYTRIPTMAFFLSFAKNTANAQKEETDGGSAYY